MSAIPVFDNMQGKRLFNWPALLCVVLAHAGLLAFLLIGFPLSSSPITPPMIGVLLSPASSSGGTAKTGAEKPAKSLIEKQGKQEKKQQQPSLKENNKPGVTQALPAQAASTQKSPEKALSNPSSSSSVSAGSGGGASGSNGTGPFFSPRVDASHLNNPKPAYPVASRKMAEEGTVKLSVYILANGTVAEIRLKKSSGYPRLDEAAIKAVKQWRYLPARQGDTPIPYWYTQDVHFSLTN